MKESKKIIQSLVFDDYEYALSIKSEAEKKVKRIKIGLIISAITSIISIFLIAAPSDINATLRGVCVLLVIASSIASYIVGGGFLMAVSAAKKFAMFGWYLLPFPMDIALGLCTMLYAAFAFFLFPIVFVFINYRQQNKNLKEATEYLSHYKPAEYATSAENSGE